MAIKIVRCQVRLSGQDAFNQREAHGVVEVENVGGQPVHRLEVEFVIRAPDGSLLNYDSASRDALPPGESAVLRTRCRIPGDVPPEQLRASVETKAWTYTVSRVEDLAVEA
jgi:hypothetical protein